MSTVWHGGLKMNPQVRRVLEGHLGPTPPLRGQTSGTVFLRSCTSSTLVVGRSLLKAGWLAFDSEFWLESLFPWRQVWFSCELLPIPHLRVTKHSLNSLSCVIWIITGHMPSPMACTRFFFSFPDRHPRIRQLVPTCVFCLFYFVLFYVKCPTTRSSYFWIFGIVLGDTRTFRRCGLAGQSGSLKYRPWDLYPRSISCCFSTSWTPKMWPSIYHTPRATKPPSALLSFILPT